MSFPSFFGDGALLRCWDHAFIDFILVGMACRLCTVDRRHVRPELLATRATPLSPMQRNDLAGGRIHGDPNPLLVRLLLDEAPHLIGFRCQPRHPHGERPGGGLGMQVLGTSRATFHQKVQQPGETHPNGTADPTEGDALAQQLLDPQALLGRNASVQGGRRQLAMARFTWMVLGAMAGRAIFLVSLRSTRGAYISGTHGCWRLRACGTVFDQQ